jgi:hypothetical protein
MRLHKHWMKRIPILVGGCCTVAFLSAIPCATQTPPDFPMWCKGAAGMASSEGKNLIIDFKHSDKPAPKGLASGQCSWLDRPLLYNEPSRIVSEQLSVSTAKQVASQINAGADWSFWVFNVGRFFKATASISGSHRNKPTNIDD